jgi:hypothetical protein
MSATSTRKLRFGRNMIVVICCALGLAGTVSASAQELRIAADGRLQGLADLYAADAVAIVSEICVQRFPETNQVWAQAATDFRLKNRDTLAELDRLQAKVIGALRAKLPATVELDTLATIVSARMEFAAFAFHMLALMNDAQAQPYCDSTRALYPNDPLEPDLLKRARTAAAAAVEDLS